MSALMDSNPVLVQKLTAMGLDAAYITRLVNAGVTTMSRLAFCANYNPSMPDDTAFVNFMENTLEPGGG